MKRLLTILLLLAAVTLIPFVPAEAANCIFATQTKITNYAEAQKLFQECPEIYFNAPVKIENIAQLDLAGTKNTLVFDRNKSNGTQGSLTFDVGTLNLTGAGLFVKLSPENAVTENWPSSGAPYEIIRFKNTNSQPSNADAEAAIVTGGDSAWKEGYSLKFTPAPGFERIEYFKVAYDSPTPPTPAPNPTPGDDGGGCNSLASSLLLLPAFILPFLREKR